MQILFGANISADIECSELHCVVATTCNSYERVKVGPRFRSQPGNGLFSLTCLNLTFVANLHFVNPLLFSLIAVILADDTNFESNKEEQCQFKGKGDAIIVIFSTSVKFIITVLFLYEPSFSRSCEIYFM